MKVHSITLVLFILLSFFSENSVGRSLEVCGKEHRSFHIIPNRLTIEELSSVMQEAKNAGFCTMVLGIRSGLSINSINIKSSIPIMDKNYLTGVADIAKELDLEVVPELKLLTHQEHFLKQQYPDQMLNLTTYDPESKVVNQLVQSVLLELVNLLNAKAVHIGHDEVAGITKYSKKHFMNAGESILPPDKYLGSVLTLHQFLNSINVQTWMWGDMLIESNESPGMLARYFHGDLPGYGRRIRDRLPRDIVIFDWHYYDETEDFNSLGVFVADGFDVVGVAYTDNLFNLFRSTDKYGALGIMSTNWDMALKPDVMKYIDRIKLIGTQFK